MLVLSKNHLNSNKESSSWNGLSYIQLAKTAYSYMSREKGKITLYMWTEKVALLPERCNHGGKYYYLQNIAVLGFMVADLV